MVTPMKCRVLVNIFFCILLVIYGLVFPTAQGQPKAEPVFSESEQGNNEIAPVVLISKKQERKKALSSADRENKGFDKKKKQQNHDKGLLQSVADDGQNDTALFLKGLNAYRQQDFAFALKNFKDFIKTYPSGRYSEKARFILAETFASLHSDEVPAYFEQMKAYYNDAVNRFPQSIYFLDALVAIADLNFKMNYFTEALGYYNYALGQGRKFSKKMHALIQKAKIFVQKKKFVQAKYILENVLAGNPGRQKEIEAKLLMSRLLYEMNAFEKSLDILSEFNRNDFHKFYKYPEIFLYKGRNYYQTGEFQLARKNLFYFYNLSVEQKDRHLVLARIGDTFRDEKKINKAVKIYQLVYKRFPETQAAVISLIRLAEIQKQSSVKTKHLIEMSSRQIYENIINKASDNEINKKFIPLAMLKLAGGYLDEQAYGKSLDILKRLSSQDINKSLESKRKYVLQNVLESMIKNKMNQGDYNYIIKTYVKEKDLFLNSDSKLLLLSVAKAYKQLDFENRAIQIFRKIEPFLPDSEKPPEFVLLLSRRFILEEKFKQALAVLNSLHTTDLPEKYAGLVFQEKGRIFLALKKNSQAVDMFHTALTYPIQDCRKTSLLVSLAKVLSRSGFKQKAVKTVEQAEAGMKKKCHAGDSHLYEETGDIFLDLGYPLKAADRFKKAVEAMEKPENKIRIKVKLAQSYFQSDNIQESIEIYRQVADANQPFWSNLAKERIEKINFDRAISNQVDQGSG